MFLLSVVLGDRTAYILGLVPRLVSGGMIWQVFTYMFMHSGFWHLFFNMFVLYIFGAELERIWGSDGFLKYYLFSGVFAGVCSFILYFGSRIPIVGASGAIYGLLVAYGMLFPNRYVYLYLLVPIKAKYLVMLLGVIELFSSISGASGGVAHFAHLGGILGGFLYIVVGRYIGRRKLQKRKIVEIEDFLRRNDENKSVDEILDKIIREGIESLTPDEKKRLIKAGHFFRDMHH